jgi:transcriptional regulator with PAS, ATPase and Fis domain
LTTQEKEEKREVSDIEKKVYEMISDGVMMVDRHGIIRYMNKAGFEILGVSQDAIGKPLTEITRFKPELYDVLTTGIGWVDKEFILDMKNKKSLHLVKSAIPLFDENNNIIGVLDTFREINNVRNTINKMTGARSKFTFEDIKYRSSLMQKQVELAKKIAASDSVVLIQGESGTGKELFAHAIHGYSSRKDGPFITLDCATIPHDLVESELFGYVEGAFTGARRGGRPGKFEMAHDCSGA